MMLKRRCPRETAWVCSPHILIPESSGPRWAMAAVMRRTKSSSALPQIPAMPHISNAGTAALQLGKPSGKESFDRGNKQIPSEASRDELFHTPWNPRPGAIFFQRQMSHTQAHVVESTKEFPYLGFAKGEGNGTFRPVGRVMDKVFCAEILPAAPQEVVVMQLPHAPIFVAAHPHQPLLQMLSIRRPSPQAAENLQHHPGPHI